MDSQISKTGRRYLCFRVEVKHPIKKAGFLKIPIQETPPTKLSDDAKRKQLASQLSTSEPTAPSRECRGIQLTPVTLGSQSSAKTWTMWRILAKGHTEMMSQQKPSLSTTTSRENLKSQKVNCQESTMAPTTLATATEHSDKPARRGINPPIKTECRNIADARLGPVVAKSETRRDEIESLRTCGSPESGIDCDESPNKLVDDSPLCPKQAEVLDSVEPQCTTSSQLAGREPASSACVRRSRRNGNAVPEHSDKERLRRKGLRASFLALQDVLPMLKHSEKTSKVTILTNARDYCVLLQKDELSLLSEETRLKMRNRDLLRTLEHLRNAPNPSREGAASATAIFPEKSGSGGVLASTLTTQSLARGFESSTIGYVSSMSSDDIDDSKQPGTDPDEEEVDVVGLDRVATSFDLCGREREFEGGDDDISDVKIISVHSLSQEVESRENPMKCESPLPNCSRLYIQDVHASARGSKRALVVGTGHYSPLGPAPQSAGSDFPKKLRLETNAQKGADNPICVAPSRSSIAQRFGRESERASEEAKPRMMCEVEHASELAKECGQIASGDELRASGEPTSPEVHSGRSRSQSGVETCNPNVAATRVERVRPSHCSPTDLGDETVKTITGGKITNERCKTSPKLPQNNAIVEDVAPKERFLYGREFGSPVTNRSFAISSSPIVKDAIAGPDSSERKLTVQSDGDGWTYPQADKRCDDRGMQFYDHVNRRKMGKRIILCDGSTPRRRFTRGPRLSELEYPYSERAERCDGEASGFEEDFSGKSPMLDRSQDDCDLLSVFDEEDPFPFLSECSGGENALHCEDHLKKDHSSRKMHSGAYLDRIVSTSKTSEARQAAAVPQKTNETYTAVRQSQGTSRLNRLSELRKKLKQKEAALEKIRKSMLSLDDIPLEVQSCQFY